MLDREERDSRRDLTMAMLRMFKCFPSESLIGNSPYFLGVFMRNLMEAPGNKTPSGTNKKGSLLGILLLSMTLVS